MAQNIRDLTKLDFDTLKTSIKEYMESQDEFTDYDFEGSGLSVLLDVLAYNTHYNALLAHVTMNESFLDTAQVRSNIVSHAQTLGYIPRSRTAARCYLDVVVTGDSESAATGTIPRGFKFKGSINDKPYFFTVLSTTTAVKLADNTYKFYKVPVYQGTIKTTNFRIDGLDPFGKYEIPSDSVDTDQLYVTVSDADNTDIRVPYTYFENIRRATPTSEVYFMNENPFGKFEIYFGDDYLGKKPDSGSKVVMEYLETDGKEANNIKTFVASDTIEGFSDIVVTISDGYTKSFGGRDKESAESVRFNAPISYATQNRAVTADDYRVLIMREFADIQDISVWGGEDNDPPIYGKVFVAAALKNQERPTETFLNSIKTFLKDKNVGAITPEIMEAEYTNLELEVDFKYDTNKTSKTVGELESLVRSAITEYNDDYLNTFNGILRASNLTSKIDALDSGILNSVMRIRMFKKFRPNPLKTDDYTIKFPNTLYISYTDEPVIASSTFLLDGVECKISDEPMTGSEPMRRLFVKNNATDTKITKYSDIGYIDPEAGTVYIQSVKFDLSNYITLYVKPDSFDIAPKYSQLINISSDNIIINSELDTVSLLGSTGLSNYKTFSRH